MTVDLSAPTHYLSCFVSKSRRKYLESSAPSALRFTARVSLTASVAALVGCHADIAGSSRFTEPVTGDGDGIGIPGDATVKPGPSEDSGRPGANDGGTGSACNLTGTFGFLAELDVNWDGTSIAGFVPVIAPGAGKLTIFTLISIEQTGTELRSQVKACGSEIPTFASDSIGERYAARFRDAMWDKPMMPSWNLALRAECFDSGCSLASDTLHAQLGVDLDAPQAAWPTDRNAQGLRFPDHDGDGRPGLTLDMLKDTVFTYPPVNLASWSRAKEIMLGVRVTTLFDGVIDDCDHFTGVGPATKVETRAATCTVDRVGAEVECTKTDSPFGTSEASFLDGNLPKWEVTAARWTGVRLADTATCVDARAAQY